MNNKIITILNLYSQDMNIYGDYGNVLCLKKRIEWYGYKSKVIEYNHGDEFPKDVDIVIGGGGQDSGQNKIQKDLLMIGPKLCDLAEDNVPMLMICGLYQLFGHFFRTNNGDVIEGIGLLDIETFAKSERLIGNIVTHSEKFGDIVGYENHSGQTFLGPKTKPLGKVIMGAGNNTVDDGEGVIYKNVIGSYMHGSLLPKNPLIADFLIKKAVERKNISFTRFKINDEIAELARRSAASRPR